MSHALLPAFVLAWRLDAAETVGEVIEGRWQAACVGSRPAAERLGIPYTTACGLGAPIRGPVLPGLGVAFAALTVELGGDPVCPAG